MLLVKVTNVFTEHNKVTLQGNIIIKKFTWKRYHNVTGECYQSLPKTFQGNLIIMNKEPCYRTILYTI